MEFIDEEFLSGNKADFAVIAEPMAKNPTQLQPKIPIKNPNEWILDSF